MKLLNNTVNIVTIYVLTMNTNILINVILYVSDKIKVIDDSFSTINEYKK